MNECCFCATESSIQTLSQMINEDGPGKPVVDVMSNDHRVRQATSPLV